MKFFVTTTTSIQSGNQVMSTEHPITPPPELVQQWAADYWGNVDEPLANSERHIATQAARWGADQELEAELVPLTDKAMDMVPRLAGHEFFAQGRAFAVTGVEVTFNDGEPPVVAICCKEISGVSPSERLQLLLL